VKEMNNRKERGKKYVSKEKQTGLGSSKTNKQKKTNMQK